MTNARNVPPILQWIVLVVGLLVVAALAYTGHPVDLPTGVAIAAGFVGLSGKAATTMIANASAAGAGAAKVVQAVSPVVHEIVEATREPSPLDYRQLAAELVPNLMPPLLARVDALATLRMSPPSPTTLPAEMPTAPAIPHPVDADPPDIADARARVLAFDKIMKGKTS